jgi:hypothetical protein
VRAYGIYLPFTCNNKLSKTRISRPKITLRKRNEDLSVWSHIHTYIHIIRVLLLLLSISSPVTATAAYVTK